MATLEELNKILSETTDTRKCCICGLPFISKRKNQKTCASRECQKELHRQYVKEYQKGEHYKQMKKYYTARWRLKKKRKAEIKAEIEAAIDNIKNGVTPQRTLSEIVKKYDGNYGEYSRQKTLAKVEPIDTNLIQSDKL